MSSLSEQVEQTIGVRRLFPDGCPILVAVSGGVDSMVLLHLLHRLAHKNGWNLTVAHLDHGLRGRSSQADARLVQRVCKTLALSVVMEKADVFGFARKHKVSIEMAAREIRHAFLARVARRLRIQHISLAHHSDDQLELFFLRLFRGSGGHGLVGMRWQSPSPADPALRVVRPLLDQPKSALREYAVTHGVLYREDSSNAGVDVPRNRIRHELLPLLRSEYQPALAKVIPRVAEILAAEADFALQVASAWLRPRVSSLNSGARSEKGPEPLSDLAVSLDAVPFDSLPVAVQRRCVQLQLIRMGAAAEFELTEELRLTANRAICAGRKALKRLSPSSKSLHKGDSHLGAEENDPLEKVTILRDNEGILRFEASQSVPFQSEQTEIKLDNPSGMKVFGQVKISWIVDISGCGKIFNRVAGSEVFDADRVGRPIRLRHWRPGDRFQPIGMKSAVKLQDLFTDQKVPRSDRCLLLLGVSVCGEIFWVEGQRISEQFKVTKTTNRVLRWCWERL